MKNVSPLNFNINFGYILFVKVVSMHYLEHYWNFLKSLEEEGIILGKIKAIATYRVFSTFK